MQTPSTCASTEFGFCCILFPLLRCFFSTASLLARLPPATSYLTYGIAALASGVITTYTLLSRIPSPSPFSPDLSYSAVPCILSIPESSASKHSHQSADRCNGLPPNGHSELRPASDISHHHHSEARHCCSHNTDMAPDNQQTPADAITGPDGTPLTMTKTTSREHPPAGQTLTGKQEHC